MVDGQPVRVKSQVRTGLLAGGRWIRTSGSARESLSRFDLLRFIWGGGGRVGSPLRTGYQAYNFQPLDLPILNPH